MNIFYFMPMTRLVLFNSGWGCCTQDVCSTNYSIKTTEFAFWVRVKSLHVGKRPTSYKNPSITCSGSSFGLNRIYSQLKFTFSILCSQFFFLLGVVIALWLFWSHFNDLWDVFSSRIRCSIRILTLDLLILLILVTWRVLWAIFILCSNGAN